MKFMILKGSLFLLLSTALVVPAWADNTRPEYVKEPVFTPLPLGEIKPSGWLRDWSEDAAAGIAGHADQIDQAFKKGWLDASVKANNQGMQPGDRTSGYALEQAGYWLDGAIRLAHLLGDESLLAKCRVRFEAILKRVEAKEPPMDVNRDLWAAGDKWAHWPMAVMGRALLAEYSATEDPRYLRAVEQIYSDYAKYNEATNDKGKMFSLIQHSGRQPMNAEVMWEAYRLGGRPELKADAIAILRAQDGEIAERLEWHEAGITRGGSDRRFYRVNYGHAVTFNESTKIPAIGYSFTGDENWLRFSEASYEDMEKNEMQPYGLTSAHEQLGGVGPFSMTEMCNAVDYAWSATWLLRVTGKSKYGDWIERDFFNAGPGGVAPDFKSHVYFLSPNRIDTSHPRKVKVGGSPAFAPRHLPLCCTGNLARLIPNYVMHLWMASADRGLAATLYGPCEVKTTVHDTAISLVSRTDHPFSDRITIEVRPERPVEFPLHLRLPEWCEKPQIQINGKAVSIEATAGFAKINREWKAGDVVQLTLPSQPEIHAGKCADGAPFSFATWGPLLFALKIPTLGDDLNAPQPGAEFQFALQPGSKAEGIRLSMPKRWSWNAASLKVKVSALPISFGEGFALPKLPVNATGLETKEIELVPFGSTAFRISMFGVMQ